MRAPRDLPFLSRHLHPILSLLDSCKSLLHIKQSHAQLISAGLAAHPFPASKLVALIASLPLSSSSSTSTSSLAYADLVLHSTPSPTLFTYNTLIKAHRDDGSPSAALLLFRSMLRRASDGDGQAVPNQYTFVFLLGAGGDGLEVGEVEQVRGQAVRRGLDGNVYVCNVLVRAYGGLRRMEDARKVFDWCTERDLVSWNSLVGVYVGAGDVHRAREVFDGMPQRDVVSWSTMVAGYVQVSFFIEAIELFREMQLSGTMANEFTVTSILAACANLVALDQGKWVHAYISKARIKINERLLAALVDMYAKCGEIDFASRIFYEFNPKRTVRPWNAMLSGYAIHGQSKEAVYLFERMNAENIEPDGITFVSLLHACSHGRLADKGKFYFKSMSNYGIDPEIEHYGCMVDLLGRAGLLKEAEEFISAMPIMPDTVVWGTLLGACRIHGDTEMVLRVSKIITELDPEYVGCHVLLANIYSVSGRWADAKHVRNKIKSAGGRKTPGCSSIELDGTFHQFLVGDRSHPQTKQIYSFLDEMAKKLKAAGYAPETREVLLDVAEEDKETALSRHSEKLAIAFGLINTSPGATIRIVKNLRVCIDCHHTTKFISKVYDREIVVRDRIRFHHFKHGSCSCEDYW